MVVLTGTFSRAIHIASAACHTLDSLTDLIALTFIVIATDLLTDVFMAELVALTVGVDVTNRFAEAALTLEVVSTLLVGDALDGLAGTCNHWRGVGEVASRADAEGSLVDGLTEGIGSADGVVAGVNTLVVDARQ